MTSFEEAANLFGAPKDKTRHDKTSDTSDTSDTSEEIYKRVM